MSNILVIFSQLTLPFIFIESMHYCKILAPQSKTLCAIPDLRLYFKTQTNNNATDTKNHQNIKSSQPNKII